MGISVYPPASGGITTRTLKQAVFNTSGTWTYPSSSKFDGTVEVTCVAGGGGGGAGFVRGSGITYHVGAGGGGGGQVILRRQLSVLNSGNQTVTVGEGGPAFYQTGALFGHISSFGSGYVRNLYPDPELTKGLFGYNASVGSVSYPETASTGDYPTMFPPLLWTSGTNPPQPPVGRTYVSLNLNSNSPIYSQYVPVKASTSYRIIFSHTFRSSGGVTVSPQVFWFNTNGEQTNSSSLTSFVTQSSSGTWTAVTTTVTSSADAAYGRIVWNASSAANYMLSGIQFAETAANITTVISGNSSGYTWTGVPDNSYTVGENETLIAAQGGGGGWGFTWRINNSGALFYLPGHAGYTGGGLATSLAQNSIPNTRILISGGGGGAGGNAKSPEAPTHLAPSTGNRYILNDSEAHSARYGFQTSTDGNHARWHAAIHTAAAYTGSDGIVYEIPDGTVFPAINFGENGIGVEGYGYGGSGAARANTSLYGNYFRSTGSGNPAANTSFGTNFSPTSETHQAAYRGMPNSGNGGSGWIGAVAGNSTDYSGPRGGSGVVIVRWYE